MGSMLLSCMWVVSRDWWVLCRIMFVIFSGFFVLVIVLVFCLKVLICQLGYFLWCDWNCVIVFLMVFVVLGLIDVGVLGLVCGVFVGVVGFGVNCEMILDMVLVVKIRMIRNMNMNFMFVIIRLMVCDISLFIMNSYLY